jgi:hypothetical protein
MHAAAHAITVLFIGVRSGSCRRHMANHLPRKIAEKNSKSRMMSTLANARGDAKLALLQTAHGALSSIESNRRLEKQEA